MVKQYQRLESYYKLSQSITPRLSRKCPSSTLRNGAMHLRQTPALLLPYHVLCSDCNGISADTWLNHDTSTPYKLTSVCLSKNSSPRAHLIVLRWLCDRWVPYLGACYFGSVFFGIVEKLAVIPVSGCKVLVLHRDCGRPSSSPT